MKTFVLLALLFPFAGFSADAPDLSKFNGRYGLTEILTAPTEADLALVPTLCPKELSVQTEGFTLNSNFENYAPIPKEQKNKYGLQVQGTFAVDGVPMFVGIGVVGSMYSDRVDLKKIQFLGLVDGAPADLAVTKLKELQLNAFAGFPIDAIVSYRELLDAKAKLWRIIDCRYVKKP